MFNFMEELVKFLSSLEAFKRGGKGGGGRERERGKVEGEEEEKCSLRTLEDSLVKQVAS